MKAPEEVEDAQRAHLAWIDLPEAATIRWGEILRPLRRQPRRWARVYDAPSLGAATSVAYNIRTCRGSVPNEWWEARSRYHAVYARWLGPDRPAPLVMKVGGRLVSASEARQIREGAGASVHDVGAVLGVHGTAVSTWELEQRRPTALNSQRWAALLGELAEVADSRRRVLAMRYDEHPR